MFENCGDVLMGGLWYVGESMMMVMERAVGEGLWLVSCVEDVSRAVVLQVETLRPQLQRQLAWMVTYSTTNKAF